MIKKLVLTLTLLLTSSAFLLGQRGHYSNVYFKNGTSCVTQKVVAYCVGPCGNVINYSEFTLEPGEVEQFMFQVDYGIQFKSSNIEQYCPEPEVEVVNQPEGRSENKEYVIYKGGDYLRGRTIVFIGGIKA